MRQAHRVVPLALVVGIFLCVGGCHAKQAPVPPGPPGPSTVTLTPPAPMRPTAARPAPCQGPDCHVCAPVPMLGTGISLFNGPNRPWNGTIIGELATGDLNGDGIADVVDTDPTTGEVGVFLDRGDGTWAGPTKYSVGGVPTAVVVTDVNGDGWPDVLVLDAGDGTHAGWVDVLQGLPGGVLHLTGEVAVGRSPNALKVGDLDGDGHPDIVVTNTGDDTLGVSLGRGDGTFARQATYPAGALPRALVLADFDGDGHLDAAVAQSQEPGGIDVLRGRGDGTFGPPHLGITGIPIGRLETADLNGDGKPDLMTSVDTSNVLTPALGQGDGTFVAGTPLNLDGAVLAVALGDLDGDGDVDLVVDLVRSLWTPDLEALHNDGQGHFTQAGAYFGPVNGSRGAVDGIHSTGPLVIADLNGDGAPDLVEGHLFQVNLRMNQGDGTFPNPVLVSTVDGAHLQIADLNGDGQRLFDLNDDGRLDVVVASREGLQNPTFGISVLLGQADGVLGPGPASFGVDPFPGSLYSFTLGDVDGDGAPDLVLLGLDGNVQVRLGRGDGSFVQGTSFTQDGDPLAPILTDVDGDGHADLVMALQMSEQVAVRLGRGDGTFEAAVTYPLTSPPADLALGDVDGDGIPDLVVAGGGRITVLEGHGDGTFTVGGVFDTKSAPGDDCGLALGDLDGDGHLDVVVAGSLSQGVSVLKGRGDGTFDKARLYPTFIIDTTNPQAGIADVDGDGVPDIEVGGIGNVGVLHGRGDGTFDPVVTFTDDGYGEPMSVTDLDANGQPDLVLAGTQWRPGVTEILDPPLVCATR